MSHSIPKQGQHAEAYENEGPLRFERRAAPRWEDHGQATAFVLGGASFGHMVDLRLTDSGHCGLGARSDTPLTPGTTVSLGFSHFGRSGERGVVVRCVPCGDGYYLGIRFEGRLAA